MIFLKSQQNGVIFLERKVIYLKLIKENMLDIDKNNTLRSEIAFLYIYRQFYLDELKDLKGVVLKHIFPDKVERGFQFQTSLLIWGKCQLKNGAVYIKIFTLLKEDIFPVISFRFNHIIDISCIFPIIYPCIVNTNIISFS